MTNLNKYSGFIGSIYDCVADQALWPNTLQSLCDHFGGVLATLAVMDIETNKSRFGSFCGNPDIVIPLITTYAAEMPFYSVLPLMEIDRPYRMEEIYGLFGANAKDKFYSGKMGEWTIPNRIADAFCLSLLKQDLRVGTFVISTTTDRPEISQFELDELALIAPHIRRAVTIGDLFEVEQREANIFREVMDAFTTAILVVEVDMKLGFANTAAENFLSDGTIIKSSGPSLFFQDQFAQSAIQKAILLGQRNEVALGTLGIGVPLSKSQRPAVAHVLPLGRRSQNTQFKNGSAAVIFVAAAGGTTVPAIDAIAALFGLTAAEKRVATQVANGFTRAEIAAASGVTDGTVKSQLTAIYEKTNAKGQRELELLIRDLTPPVATKPL